MHLLINFVLIIIGIASPITVVIMFLFRKHISGFYTTYLIITGILSILTFYAFYNSDGGFLTFHFSDCLFVAGIVAGIFLLNLAIAHGFYNYINVRLHSEKSSNESPYNSVISVKKCPYCNKEWNNKYSFCPLCGKKIE